MSLYKKLEININYTISSNHIVYKQCQLTVEQKISHNPMVFQEHLQWSKVPYVLNYKGLGI